MQFAGFQAAVVFILCQLAAGVPAGDQLDCEVRLRNGSIIRGGCAKLEHITIKLKYGDLKVPLRDVRSMSWGDSKKKELDTMVAVAGTYKGWIEELPPIELDTGFGKLAIPTNAIKTIRFLRQGDKFGDDFSSGDLANWSTYGAAQWQIADEKLTCTPSGNYDGILYSEVLEDEWCLEAEVSSSNGTGILFCAEDNQNAAALWLNPGQVMVFCGSPWYGQQVQTWRANGLNQGTFKIKLEFADGKATVYVNDAKIGETSVPRKRGRVGFFSMHQPASFDNFTIEK